MKSDQRIDYMYSKDLKIIQDDQSFSYTLDSLLLADYAKQFIAHKTKVADLCSGNCAATMYMAFFNDAKYDAVEVQSEIVEQARESIKLNQMDNRIAVHEMNVLDAPRQLRKDHYDLVTVNPPYFKVNDGHKVNPDPRKAIARHEVLINLEQVIQVASGLLKMKGKLVLVHRPERLPEIIEYCTQADLAVKEIQPFVSYQGQDSNLILVQAVKAGAKAGLVLKDSIVVHKQDGSYTEQINDILYETEQKREQRLKKDEAYFYVLLCHDGTFYGGFTTDLDHRLAAHNAGKGAKYTKTRRPVKLLYHEKFTDRKLAMQRECWFKHHDRKWKEAFLIDHGVKF